MLVIFANVQDPSIFDNGYVASVSTSAVNAEVDLAVETSLSDVGSPFVIHAKVCGRILSCTVEVLNN
jgi:hypothetical protein